MSFSDLVLNMFLCFLSFWFSSFRWPEFVSCIFPAKSSPTVFVCFSFSDPPEFSQNQPTQVQVVEDDVATIPLLVSANPEEISCVWLHRREELVKGDTSLCDGSINQVLVELSLQVSTQLCHLRSE